MEPTKICCGNNLDQKIHVKAIWNHKICCGNNLDQQIHSMQNGTNKDLLWKQSGIKRFAGSNLDQKDTQMAILNQAELKKQNGTNKDLLWKQSDQQIHSKQNGTNKDLL